MSSFLEIAKQSRMSVRNNTINRLENGKYDIVIDKIDLRTRKDGQGNYFLIALRILSGDYKNEIIPEIISFHPYRVKSSIYKLEEMLESCKIELPDEAYDDVASIYEAVRKSLLNKNIRIRFCKMEGYVRIDYLHEIAIDNSEASFAESDSEDMQEVPIDGIPF